MSPAAGKMRLNTSSLGICKTNLSRALSVSRLTRMLVPKPKKAFQSPGTQSLGLPSIPVVGAEVILSPPCLEHYLVAPRPDAFRG